MGSRISAILALSWVAACGEPPRAVLENALRATERGDIKALARWVAEDYGDPLGGKEELLEGVGDLAHRFGRMAMSPSEVSISADASKVDVQAIGRMDVELVGSNTWRATGPIEVPLRREDGYQIRGGFLADLRDVMGLMDLRRRALEANDAEAYAKLLHPGYKDGDDNLEQTKARLVSDLAGKRIRLDPSLYKLELRGPLAHVDEHYVLTVDDRSIPPSIARFTLERAAGRWRIASGLY
jgi:hypothetical protein